MENALAEFTQEIAPGSESEADLEAGFSQVSKGIEPVATTAALPPSTPAAPTTPSEPSQTPDSQPFAVKPEDWQSVNERVAKIDQLEAQLRKSIDTAMGKIGGVERVLRELQSASSTGRAPNISKEAFKSLYENFPEIADDLVTGLKNAMPESATPSAAAAVAAQTLDPETIKKEVGAVLRSAEAERSTKWLDRKHAGWREVVKATDDAGAPTPYRQWLATQPQAYQDQINSSLDYEDISESLTKFATYQDDQKKAAEKEQSKAARKTRVEQTVAPKGVPGPVSTQLTDEEEFERGYKAVRSGR